MNINPELFTNCLGTPFILLSLLLEILNFNYYAENCNSYSDF